MPRHWMQFVDGENLTIRAQELIKHSQRVLTENNNFKRDCFFWPAGDPVTFGLPHFGEDNPIRSFYYTSMQGDDVAIMEVRERLWDLGFEPHVFKKTRRDVQAKGIDIALTKDMLSHGFRDNHDVAVLVAGDGDYVPLVEEVKRLGKRVEIHFISDCTNPQLKLSADRFVDLKPDIQRWGSNPRYSTEIPKT